MAVRLRNVVRPGFRHSREHNYITPATVNPGQQLGNSFVYSLGSGMQRRRQTGEGSALSGLPGYPVDAAAQAGLTAGASTSAHLSQRDGIPAPLRPTSITGF
jgi:hypothetical protein